MNKQQLANKIWESANKMRSKIEAYEYKDYILGFMFYKYLSDQELKFLTENDFTEEDIRALSEDDKETREFTKKNIGYFIGYDNLFSTWLDMGRDFDVSNVRDALSAFSRMISDSHKGVFEKIFLTLETGLSKLGDSSNAQTKSISGLLQLIKEIPMTGKQDYDVIGFIYEYLIEKFASNAGKKAGEFYTPHEVSVLISEIVAEHLKERDAIKIYDPTSGSGSLLINIGKSASKYLASEDNIKYYAQELKENTYNLTRMNLVMRGIKPDNILVRNGDTLADDWPYFDETDKENTYDPLYVDAVVSNPPYSQAWDPSGKEHDPRYQRFGIAPKGKADYAFLLHDLYHVKPDGIMAIVLPHGVLFRGGEEGAIRKNLIENNHIDAIIGLPANIFYGTGIPTIIMILKQRRVNTDVLIIDASKGFIKEGKNNKLRASDIKRIVDAVNNRKGIEKYAKVVSREEIRANDYNLNIPRYVDSSEKAEQWDMYATMFGGIPVAEIDALYDYWQAFPTLKDVLFIQKEGPYVAVVNQDIKTAIKSQTDVKDFEARFAHAFEGFDEYLRVEWVEKAENLDISQAEGKASDEIFRCLKGIPLIDRYEAYQLLDDEWTTISTDLEMIQTEGFQTVKKVDPHLVIKKKDGKEQEVQEGWLGHILPFELVQATLLSGDNESLLNLKKKKEEISSELEILLEDLDEESKDKLLNDENDAFVIKAVEEEWTKIVDALQSDEIALLEEYLKLSKKREKLEFIEKYSKLPWNKMQSNKDGETYGTKEVRRCILAIKDNFEFEEGCYEYKISRINKCLQIEKELKKEIKVRSKILHEKTKVKIENLSDDEAKDLLERKWIRHLIGELHQLPDTTVKNLVSKIEALQKKYESTYFDVEAEIRETEKQLAAMIDDLIGNEFDMKGLSAFQSLLLGENNE